MNVSFGFNPAAFARPSTAAQTTQASQTGAANAYQAQNRFVKERQKQKSARAIGNMTQRKALDAALKKPAAAKKA